MSFVYSSRQTSESQIFPSTLPHQGSDRSISSILFTDHHNPSNKMTSCLPGADSGGSQGSGVAVNDSTGGSVTTSPVISPTGTANSSTSQPPLAFSASNLCSSSVAGNVTTSVAASDGVATAAAMAGSQLNLTADCDPARLAALSYPRLPVYSAAATYPSTDQNPYPSIAVDNSFYGSLGNPYSMKDGTAPGGADMSAWSSAALQPTGYYAGYDHPTLAAYGYGGGYDLASRRKNATRESTATLKAWLNEHKKNPYPTKGEKIMLAIITKMTLTQVSTWFANARRRLKKENKMTWEPKNKLDDEDVDVSDDDDKDRDDDKHDEDHQRHHLKDGLHHHHHHQGMHDGSSDGKSSAGIPIPPSKPKIWSLADTAVCKTPPPSSGQSHLSHQPQQTQQSHTQHQVAAHHYLGANGQMGNSWSQNFSQFVDPSVVRPSAMTAAALRHHGNMFGVGYMAMPPPPPGLTAAAAAHAASQLPSSSPNVSGDSSLQTADTPPHTPPTIKNNSGQFGYNGAHNGYGQMSPSANSASDASKLLMFNNHMNNTSFKMM